MKILFTLIGAGLLLGCNNSSSEAGKAKQAAAQRPAASGTRAPVAGHSQIINGDFEQTAADGSIPGWSETQHAGVKAYEMRIEADGAYQGKGSFHMTRTQPQVYGALTQDLDLSAYAGKRVELSAMLKTRDVGPLGWILTLSAPGVVRRSEPMTGTNDWRRVTISAPLPANSRHVNIGVTLADAGDGWADDVELKVLD